MPVVRGGFGFPAASAAAAAAVAAAAVAAAAFGPTSPLSPQGGTTWPLSPLSPAGPTSPSYEPGRYTPQSATPPSSSTPGSPATPRANRARISASSSVAGSGVAAGAVTKSPASSAGAQPRGGPQRSPSWPPAPVAAVAAKPKVPASPTKIRGKGASLGAPGGGLKSPPSRTPPPAIATQRGGQHGQGLSGPRSPPQGRRLQSGGGPTMGMDGDVVRWDPAAFVGVAMGGVGGVGSAIAWSSTALGEKGPESAHPADESLKISDLDPDRAESVIGAPEAAEEEIVDDVVESELVVEDPIEEDVESEVGMDIVPADAVLREVEEDVEEESPLDSAYDDTKDELPPSLAEPLAVESAANALPPLPPPHPADPHPFKLVLWEACNKVGLFGEVFDIDLEDPLVPPAIQIQAIARGYLVRRYVREYRQGHSFPAVDSSGTHQPSLVDDATNAAQQPHIPNFWDMLSRDNAHLSRDPSPTPLPHSPPHPAATLVRRELAAAMPRLEMRIDEAVANLERRVRGQAAERAAAKVWAEVEASVRKHGKEEDIVPTESLRKALDDARLEISERIERRVGEAIDEAGKEWERVQAQKDEAWQNEVAQLREQLENVKTRTEGVAEEVARQLEAKDEVWRKERVQVRAVLEGTVAAVEAEWRREVAEKESAWADEREALRQALGSAVAAWQRESEDWRAELERERRDREKLQSVVEELMAELKALQAAQRALSATYLPSPLDTANSNLISLSLSSSLSQPDTQSAPTKSRNLPDLLTHELISLMDDTDTQEIKGVDTTNSTFIPTVPMTEADEEVLRSVEEELQSSGVLTPEDVSLKAPLPALPSPPGHGSTVGSMEDETEEFSEVEDYEDDFA
ncbi:hypothetical protein M427DRAFT_51886 [Gonapodya prolifera JEL478]|uniref:Uncharacterized protein n=1 Tax=Gonapodya prolifera (strain JEL478) TaxID=1344416 RepID=A0A139AW17_GONPJ|nr:hypothetical protein M427DRAFT_51886 [Gonapodya prolifera JEL478]|eukprot:KXS20932.1 hypothetical protein M427DRAFT_51886 [Gonapodya prolifera JEL478]